ncbi:hypothetical protein NBA69_24115, partial [Salmonella sp. NW1258]|uniref:hypothetical protein n=1 Tax=Salmonella sp. NW1258 TaxID=2947694 RepID=UPI003F48261A
TIFSEIFEKKLFLMKNGVGRKREKNEKKLKNLKKTSKKFERIRQFDDFFRNFRKKTVFDEKWSWPKTRKK